MNFTAVNPFCPAHPVALVSSVPLWLCGENCNCLHAKTPRCREGCEVSVVARVTFALFAVDDSLLQATLKVRQVRQILL